MEKLPFYVQVNTSISSGLSLSFFVFSVSQDKLPTSEGRRLYFPRETTKQIQIMSDLKRIFTPTNTDGSLDHRFNEDIEWVFNRVGNEVLEGLEKFRQETETVNINYAKFAYSLAKAFLERNSEIDHWNLQHLPINTSGDLRKSANLSNQNFKRLVLKSQSLVRLLERRS